jgi:hypothetical protein
VLKPKDVLDKGRLNREGGGVKRDKKQRFEFFSTSRLGMGMGGETWADVTCQKLNNSSQKQMDLGFSPHEG